ncbi:MAG: hypothetical protein JWP47_1069 [Polaromonas sp.]|nr:hypothetical protein [Polaromonas sp.]
MNPPRMSRPCIPPAPCLPRAGFQRLMQLLLAGAVGMPAMAADEAAQMALGKKLFVNAVRACAVCHTLKPAPKAR